MNLIALRAAHYVARPGHIAPTAPARNAVDSAKQSVSASEAYTPTISGRLLDRPLSSIA